MVDCSVKLVAAPRITEPDDVAIVLGQRVCLYRFIGPGAGLVDTVGDVEIGHPICPEKNCFALCKFLCLHVCFTHICNFKPATDPGIA